MDIHPITARVIAVHPPIEALGNGPSAASHNPVTEPAVCDTPVALRCKAGRMNGGPIVYPDLQPTDERTALVQRLDQYRTTAATVLVDTPWDQASARALPATDLSIA